MTALVIVPTRELCLQVYETLEKLLHRFHWIVPGYVMGGEKKAKEKARLRKGMVFSSFFTCLVDKRSRHEKILCLAQSLCSCITVLLMLMIVCLVG